MPVHDFGDFGEQVFDVGEDFEGRIVGEIFLEKAIAAIHRTVGNQTDDQIVATHQAGRARGTVFEKSRALAGEEQAPFPFAEWVTARSWHGFAAPVFLPVFFDDANRHVREFCEGPACHRGILFAAFDQDFGRLVVDHVSRSGTET